MLPKAPRGFEWVEHDAGPALVCTRLAPLAAHFFTTRPWPLGSAASSNRSWRAVADAAGVTRVLRLKQVHGANVVVHRCGDALAGEPPAADIIVTDDRSVAVAVQAADCVPLLIADPRLGVVAAAHAGWRGLAAGAPRAAAEALATQFNSRPADLIAAIGPSIGACCYEVGDDVRDALQKASGRRASQWFSQAPMRADDNPPFRELRPEAGKWFFDGWAAARDQLVAAGVPREQIHLAGLCTASHAGAFCSYRRDGVSAGRIAGVIRPRKDPRASAT